MRECGSCRKCCEGWLTGQAHGIAFWPGRKCHFVCETGCSIYENRPIEPCRTYKCLWLGDENFPLDPSTIPEWMQPDVSGVIMSWKTFNNIGYIEVVEAGGKIQAKILSWIIQFALNNNLNVHYQVNGGWNRFGSQEFIALNM